MDLSVIMGRVLHDKEDKMKVNKSPYLENKAALFKKLVEELKKEFKYASILATDTKGTRIIVDFNGSSVADSMLVERGCVVRVYNGICYSEYSFNEFSNDSFDDVLAAVTKTAKDDFEKLTSSGIAVNEYPVIDEQEIVDEFVGDAEILPESVSVEDKLAKMHAILEEAKSYSDLLIDFKVVYEEYHVSKMFYSGTRNLKQSYVFSSAGPLAVARKDGDIKYEHSGVSGQIGVESLDALHPKVKAIVDNAVGMLGAERIKPGVYDVICDPLVSGLIAHEAFGHGVEMDMFVKNRAKGAEYIKKEVASEITQMHDGAKSATQVASYLFDDEGTLGTDTVVIENGILKSGISDLLSATKLGTKPTGNGRRETFERKAYARMTNTFFAPGKDNIEDMIASIDYGFLLESYNSGMEDPKNWGIQCMITRGKEIKDGKLTGKGYAPVLLTGYVPDVLKSITMVSDGDVDLSGSGHCGKGHKEWAKTSIGGTFIKLRGRLG